MSVAAGPALQEAGDGGRPCAAEPADTIAVDRRASDVMVCIWARAASSEAAAQQVVTKAGGKASASSKIVKRPVKAETPGSTLPLGAVRLCTPRRSRTGG